jgi:hypothetical protein
MAKQTIATLEAQLAAVTQERDIRAQESFQAITFANQQLAHLQAIENVINASPFANKKFKFFPTVWWVLNNFKILKEFVEAITQQIKTWREQLDELVRQSQERQNLAPQ